MGIPLAPVREGANHSDPLPRARHPPRTVRLTNHRDHAGQPPLSQVCVIEVNPDADASVINTLGSHLLMWMASVMISQTTKYLVACLRSLGFHSLTCHVARSPEAFIAIYSGLVDVASVH